MASITINLVDIVKNLSRQECQETIRLCETRLHMLQNMSLTHEEKMCVEDNRKIDAIRSFRNRTGVRLKDAKDMVDAYAANFSLSPLPLGCELVLAQDDTVAYCSHKYCPGYPYRASDIPHPCGTEGSVAERRRQEAEWKMEVDNRLTELLKNGQFQSYTKEEWQAILRAWNKRQEEETKPNENED